jgi:hypothetical protein
MESINFELPKSDFKFQHVIKLKAEKFIVSSLNQRSIQSVSKGLKGTVHQMYREIDEAVCEFRIYTQRLLFFGEILNHLVKIKEDGTDAFSPTHEKDYKETITLIQFYIYNLCEDYGFKIDTDAFDAIEAVNVQLKIEDIISVLTKLQAGQEVLYNEIQQIKDDFESLKADTPFGKKRWYQRLAGIVASYVGTKGADEILDVIKPYLKEILTEQMPTLIGGYLK